MIQKLFVRATSDREDEWHIYEYKDGRRKHKSPYEFVTTVRGRRSLLDRFLKHFDGTQYQVTIVRWDTEFP